MLHIPYNEATDMWSLELVAVTGVPLYPGNMDYGVLKFIIHTLGQPSDYILDSGMRTEYYFIKDNYSEQCWTFKTGKTISIRDRILIPGNSIYKNLSALMT